MNGTNDDIDAVGHFNKLTPAEAERIAMVMEEAAEVVQACGKILRHGFDSRYGDGRLNRTQLLLEVRDVIATIALMEAAGDFEGGEVAPTQSDVSRRLRYTHHQSVLKSRFVSTKLKVVE